MDILSKTIDTIKKGQIIEEQNVVSIINKMKEVFFLENNLLQLNSPIIICGDVHGQLDDVLVLFEKAGDISNQKFLFMGDYVDRGHFSINTFLLLLCYKMKYKDNFFLLRGNHESRQVSFKYGLYSETIAYYGHPGIYFLMNDLFDLLPLSAIIDNDIFSVHGGLSPDFKYISQIQNVNRMVEVPQNGLIADLLWSDPDEVKKWILNSRGSGFIFGNNQVKEFLHVNRLKKITRSHQLANAGYQYYFPLKDKEKEKGKKASSYIIDDDDDDDSSRSSEKYSTDGSEGMLLLVWSAPNYMYTSNNKASILKYNYEGHEKYDLIIFGPSKNRLTQPGGTREGGATPYFV